jgi:hypothetical protein
VAGTLDQAIFAADPIVSGAALKLESFEETKPKFDDFCIAD